MSELKEAIKGFVTTEIEIETHNRAINALEQQTVSYAPVGQYFVTLFYPLLSKSLFQATCTGLVTISWRMNFLFQRKRTSGANKLAIGTIAWQFGFVVLHCTGIFVTPSHYLNFFDTKFLPFLPITTGLLLPISLSHHPVFLLFLITPVFLSFLPIILVYLLPLPYSPMYYCYLFPITQPCDILYCYRWTTESAQSEQASSLGERWRDCAWESTYHHYRMPHLQDHNEEAHEE